MTHLNNLTFSFIHNNGRDKRQIKRDIISQHLNVYVCIAYIFE